MRELGASEVFDYSSPTVVRDIAQVLKGRSVAGILAVGTGSAESCVAIAAATGAKRVSMASPSVSFGEVPRRKGLSKALMRVGVQMVARTVALQSRCAVRGIRARFVWGSTLMNNEVGPMLWEHYLPAALEARRHVPAPPAHVVGSGLENVQVAMDQLRIGVSGQKLVISLP
jgi:hypothetical protein